MRLREVAQRHRAALAAIVAGSIVLFAFLLAADLGSSSPGGSGASPPSAAGCPDARAGLRWYQRAQARWRWQRGARGSTRPIDGRRRLSCRVVRQAAELARARARGERHAYRRWFAETYRRWECIH